MKKKEIIITVLSVLVVALAIFVGVLAYNNHQLKSTNDPEKENDLTKYTVSFTVGFAKDGNYSVTNLVYEDGNKTVKYPMGNISFAYKMGQSVNLHQGIDTEITNNKIAYYFLEDNKEPFTLKV